jgi:hypothetical protein
MQNDARTLAHTHKWHIDRNIKQLKSNILKTHADGYDDNTISVGDTGNVHYGETHTHVLSECFIYESV